MAEQDNNPIGPSGQFVYHDRKQDIDGIWITREKVEYADSTVSALAASESVVANATWIFYESDPLASDLLTWRYKSSRPVPGPWIAFTRYDPFLGPIQGRRRLVEDTGQVSSRTLTTKTTYDARDGSHVVFWEVQEINSDGSGDPGNPVFPIFDQNGYNDERGPVETDSQLVVNTGQISSISESGGTYTHIDYQTYPDNQFLLKKVTETFTLQTPWLIDVPVNEDGTVTSIYRTIKLGTDIVEGETLGTPSGVWVKVSSKAINTLISWEITDQRPVPGNNVVKSRIDLDGLKVQITELMSSAAVVAAITARETLVGTTWTKITSEKVSDLVCIKVTEQRAVPGNTVTEVKTDEDGAELTISRTLTAISSIVAGEDSTAGVWSKIDSEPVGDLVAWKIVTSRAVTGNVQAGHRISEAADGSVTSTSKQLLDATTAAYSPNYLTMTYEDTPVGQKRISRNLETASSFPVLYDRYRDPLKNNRLVIVSYQIVDASTSLPSDSAGVHHEIRHGNDLRSILITSTFSTPSSFSEYRFGAFGMPGTLDILVYSYTDACGAFIDSDSSLYPPYAYRPADSMMTEMYTEYEWFTSQPTPTACFFYMHSSLQLGKFWQGWNRVLIDAYALPTTCGGSSFTVNIAASSPVDWTTYCSTIVGNFQLISEEIVLDEGWLWKRTRLFVKMR